MNVCFSLLDEEENDRIWDRVMEELRFQPSIRVEQPPFQLPVPWVVHGLAYYPVDAQGKEFEDTVCQALITSLGDDPWCYALDWHHEGYRYDPRRPLEVRSFWVEDARYQHGGYNAYFPGPYPDGDYHFYLQRDLNWGYLGHPWRRELWLFGAPLIDALSAPLETLGFPVKEKYTQETGGTIDVN